MDSLQRTYRITRLGQARLHGGTDTALKAEAGNVGAISKTPDKSKKKGSGTNWQAFRDGWDRAFGKK